MYTASTNRGILSALFNRCSYLLYNVIETIVDGCTCDLPKGFRVQLFFNYSPHTSTLYLWYMSTLFLFWMKEITDLFWRKKSQIYKWEQHTYFLSDSTLRAISNCSRSCMYCGTFSLGNLESWRYISCTVVKAIFPPFIDWHSD